MAQFTINTQRFDPYKNFKFRVKFEDGRYGRRHQQGQRAQADDRGRSAPRGRRPEHAAHVAGQRPSSSRSRSSAGSPSTSTSRRGRTSSTAPRATRRLAEELPQGHARSRCSTCRASWCGRTRCFAAGSPSITALPELDANAHAVVIEHDRPSERGLGARRRDRGAGGGLVPLAKSLTDFWRSLREAASPQRHCPVSWGFAPHPHALRACLVPPVTLSGPAAPGRPIPWSNFWRAALVVRRPLER